MLLTIREPIVVDDALIDISATIGASFYPGHGDEADALLRRAVIAARDGERRDVPYYIYGGSGDAENRSRISLAAELRRAIERRELVVHYQPKVDFATGAPRGAEVLVRWPHASKGLIPPMQFVPIAEQTGLIRPMTMLVMDLAIRQQHAWMQDQGALPVAVNLSARNLYDPRLLEVLDGLLKTWGLPPELIEFEITESALVDDPEVAKQVLAHLRGIGCKIYIDDFGTGYSSLNYLVTLPVHALKIDRSFVLQMARSREAHAVVAAVISMAHNLDLRVVAEGVETEHDGSLLRALGCDDAQGYVYGKPMPAEDYARWLAERRTIHGANAP
jgi:EAL domain-containing protein (putative c-di-GMP-specific phosphodiesterase class I)